MRHRTTWRERKYWIGRALLVRCEIENDWAMTAIQRRLYTAKAVISLLMCGHLLGDTDFYATDKTPVCVAPGPIHYWGELVSSYDYQVLYVLRGWRGWRVGLVDDGSY